MDDARDFASVDDLVEQAIRDEVFAGAQLAVGNEGELRYLRAYGRTQRVPVPGAPVDDATRFDVASLTKIVSTTAVVMRLVDSGRLDLDAPVRPWLPELGDGTVKATITARHLLEHSAGMHWWKPFFETLAAEARPGEAPRDALVRLAAAVPLDAPPRTRSVYTDLGFILLATVCERIAGERIDALARRLVWQPLGMESTGYVDLSAPRPAATYAATELCPRRGLLVGQVHDDNAHAAGGVCGHAGVFSTAADLARFAAAYTRSWRGELVSGGFPPALARAFAAPAPVQDSTRSLGWDRPSQGAGASQAGDRWPRADAVGHGGFTGTSMWLDLAHARWIVLVTNRVHPSRADERIKQVRPKIHDAVLDALTPR
jgi:CubicO group peptidase (beta-lactamase class C family)